MSKDKIFFNILNCSRLEPGVTHLCVGRDKAKQGLDNARLNNEVPKVCAVASNIAKRPDRLFRYVVMGRAQQRDERGYSTAI